MWYINNSKYAFLQYLHIVIWADDKPGSLAEGNKITYRALAQQEEREYMPQLLDRK
jgi:hypothetical protein